MSFELGDEVIDVRLGKGIIRSTNFRDDYPLFVEFEKNNKVGEYTEEGKERTTDVYPVLYHIEDFVPPSCSEPKRHLIKPFDKVLVCGGKECPWILSLFARYDSNDEHYPYETVNGSHWMHCIPFEGNEEKLGTEYRDD